MRHNPASGAIVIMLRQLKMHGVRRVPISPDGSVRRIAFQC